MFSIERDRSGNEKIPSAVAISLDGSFASREDAYISSSTTCTASIVRSIFKSNIVVAAFR